MPGDVGNSSSQKSKSINNIKIPNWVKNNAKWWAAEQIGDQAFASSIQYMIEKEIILIPNLPETTQNFNEIPSWVKNIAGFWGRGSISDEGFVNSIQYLVRNGIIRIP